MKLFGLNILSNKALAAAAREVGAIALTEAQQAAAALKKTTVGSAVVSMVTGVSKQPGMSGAQKFEQVLAGTLPLILSLLSDGGVKAAAKEVEDIGRELVQSVYNDVKSTTASTVATVILRLLKRL